VFDCALTAPGFSRLYKGVFRDFSSAALRLNGGPDFRQPPDYRTILRQAQGSNIHLTRRS
jgi:hypothetical protein